MIQFTQYAGRFDSLRGSMTKLPEWGRLIVGIFAIPGLALAALSILLFLVSILALLLLTLPVYSLLKKLTETAGGSAVSSPTAFVENRGEPSAAGMSPGVKRVESTIVE